ncbi:MAG: hypothetical protein J6S21_06030, partial [Victivallales bacterium]|nr:hypothetical protein [Victivallales bacterium]
MKKVLLTLALIVLTAGFAGAFDTTALQLSIWAPKTQLVPPEIAVSGLKLNLPFGSNYSVTGLDLGLISINNSQGEELNAKVSALQVNLWNSTNGEFTGFQVGLVNLADTSNGIEIGALCNIVQNTSSGISVGLLNSSLEFHGVQIGLINYTEFLTGLQIGLINIATKSTLPFFP